jgi:hypothetical protein
MGCGSQDLEFSWIRGMKILGPLVYCNVLERKVLNVTYYSEENGGEILNDLGRPCFQYPKKAAICSALSFSLVMTSPETGATVTLLALKYDCTEDF